MAKDKKQDRAMHTHDIDVRSGARESDSDLDIQALLRKYMPDYDREGAAEDTEEDMLNSREFHIDMPDEKEDTAALERIADTAAKKDRDDDFTEGITGLDAAFSAPPEDDTEFTFTDDISTHSMEEDGGLEDEEGIYEDDEVDVRPRKRDKAKKHTDHADSDEEQKGTGLFSFLRGGRSKKKNADFTDEWETVEETPDMPTDDELDDMVEKTMHGAEPVQTAETVHTASLDTAEALGDSLMGSMGLEEAEPELRFDTLRKPTPSRSAPTKSNGSMSALQQFAADLLDDDEPQSSDEVYEMPDEAMTEPAAEMPMEVAEEDTHLSDDEMLRLAEEMLRGTNRETTDTATATATAAAAAKVTDTASDTVPDTAAEAETAAEDFDPAASTGSIPVSDDDFDPTDINLMVAFGMEDGKKKAGKTAKQLGDRLEHEKVTREGKKVKLDRPEYVDRSQNSVIEKGYRSHLAGLCIRLGICAIFTVLLLLFENIEILAKLFTGTAKQFGGVFDPAVYPVVYAMASLQLMLLACLCAYDEILRGFRYLFRGIPNPESMTALLVVAGILYTVVIARITVQSDEPVMFNFVVAVAALLTIVFDILATRREMMNFRVISSDKQKYIVCRVSDDQSRGEATAFSEEEDVCDVMRIEKTDFIDGFYNRLYTPDGTTNIFMSCAMGVMVAAAVLFGILTSVRGGSAIEIARVACVTMMVVSPLSVYVSLGYPFYRANAAAAEYESAIIGEVSLGEYSNASIVTFDDKNVFPSYSVKVQNIRIFNNARIDRVLYYAASVFAKAGGPLQDVFEIATLEVGHSENVQIFGTETGFLAAEVDGVNIIFGSGAALSKKGLRIRKQEMEDDMDLSDELSVMYMFREDKLVAKMYIQYVMDSDIELILGQFQNSGLYGCVRTFDPNIDERMIARKVKMKRMPLKVIRYNEPEEVTAYTEKVDSGLVTSGSPKSLLQIISYCDKVLHTRKTNLALAILAILVGAAIMLLLVLSSSIGIMNSLFIILYQLLWLIPMLLTSRMFIR